MSDSARSLISALHAAGLTGRGGAGFPSSIKVASMVDNEADLIVNACDGERGATKDAWVVDHHLDAVIYAVGLLTDQGKRQAWYAAHRGSPTAQRLAQAGLEVLEVPHRYVSSEGTALVNLLSGGWAKPLALREPSAFGGRDSSGRRIDPTVVFNAETLWRLAQITQYGPGWFASHGTADEPGPRLVSIGGYVSRPTVLDTQAGVSIAQLFAHAGGLPADAQHLLIGGLGGGFIPTEQAVRLAWGRQWLAPLGVGIGSGVIEVLDPRQCPLVLMGQLIDYAAGESAGQCGPCMFGLPALADDWYALVMQPGSADEHRQRWEQIQRHLDLLPGRGACHFPDGVSRWARSGLGVFAEHVHAHQQGWCPTASGAGAQPGWNGRGPTGQRTADDTQMWR